jgi:RNA polymerase sigma-70 factor (ECF subfamily)
VGPLGSLNDYELLTLFQQGNRNAYEEIYHRYWSVIFRHARKMLRGDEEAKDLVQEVFSTFWTDGPRLEIRNSLSAYLYTVMRFKVFNLIDKQKVRQDYLSSLETFIEKNEYTSDYKVRESQMEALIEKEIAALPEKMRVVFKLSRKSNLSYKEIAEKLTISENTVKKQIHNALKILRSRLGAVIFGFLFL